MPTPTRRRQSKVRQRVISTSPHDCRISDVFSCGANLEGPRVGKGRAIMGAVRLLATLIVLCLGMGAMFAQTPALDSASGRKVDLTVAQQQILYQSVSNTQKNNAAPPGFRATVGAQVPG